MTVLVVSFVQYDMEGTFSQVIGVASTPERAEEMKAEYKRLLLAKRNDSNSSLVYCAQCGFGKALHDPNGKVMQELKDFGKRHGTTERIQKLIDCPFKAPPPITELRVDEDFVVEEISLDALPTEA